MILLRFCLDNLPLTTLIAEIQILHVWLSLYSKYINVIFMVDYGEGYNLYFLMMLMILKIFLISHFCWVIWLILSLLSICHVDCNWLLSWFGNVFSHFFNCYLAAPQPTLPQPQGERLSNPMLITVFNLCRPVGHCRLPHNEIGSLNPANHLVGFEPGTILF